MNPYHATIIDKQFFQGKLTVRVQFKNADDTDSFEEQFITTTTQDPMWPNEQIQRKLNDVNGIVSTVLPQLKLSARITPTTLNTASLDDPRADYKNDLVQFDKFVSALAKGFTDQQNADFIALKKKLTDNFKTEYLDLF